MSVNISKHDVTINSTSNGLYVLDTEGNTVTIFFLYFVYKILYTKNFANNKLYKRKFLF